jgi:hypothetical protein
MSNFIRTEQVTDMVNHPMVISTVAKNSTGDYVVNPAIDADYPFRIILGFGTIYYPRIYSPNTGSSWHYNIGLGNIFVRLNGTSSLAGSNYSVLVKPAPPNMSDTFNGWSWTQWAVTALPMFQANLDPNVNYTVKVTYTGSRTEQNQNPSVNFGTLETFQDMSLVTAKSDSSSTSSSSSAGSSGVSSGSSASTTGSSASSGGSSDTSQTTTASSNNGLTTGALVGAVVSASRIILIVA